ncbi:MAG: 30S ribosomal protein S13 [Candidatus Saliniplasma sp.]
MADEEYDEDFQYIVRLMNTDIDGEKPVLYALRQIKGVGTRVAETIVKSSDIDPMIKIGKLDENELEKLKTHIHDFSEEVPDWIKNRKRDPVTGKNDHLFGATLDNAHREDINRMKKISSYKGIRHETGQKVRGQRTKSNGRTGMELGVQKKKITRQAEAE